MKKLEPNYNPSGKLAAEVNTVNGIVLKYNGDIDGHLPINNWRLYVFKNGKVIETVFLNGRDFFLLGRERGAVQIPLDHLSCSKQHAAIQFRKKFVNNEEKLEMNVNPYIIDLESSNGTFLNEVRIESLRFVELKHKDILKFASSSREFVIIKE